MQSNSEKVLDMKTTHIIAFIKDPKSEPVKTRLAAGIGSDSATILYCLFLEILAEQLARLSSLGFQSTIAHSPVALSASTTAIFHGFQFIHQGKGNIGERINHIDHRLFGESDAARVFIGSDAPTLPDQYLLDASRALRSTDSVIAPAADGGFVLLGSRKKLPNLSNVPWSHDTTASETINTLRASQFSLTVIDTWEDIDDSESLRRMLTNTRQTSSNHHTSSVIKMLELCERVVGQTR
jgi:rSAM/selenodomain-associated transferase 1